MDISIKDQIKLSVGQGENRFTMSRGSFSYKQKTSRRSETGVVDKDIYSFSCKIIQQLLALSLLFQIRRKNPAGNIKLLLQLFETIHSSSGENQTVAHRRKPTGKLSSDP